MKEVVKKTKLQKTCNNIILIVLALMFFAGFWAIIIDIMSFQAPPVDISGMGFLEVQMLILKTKWMLYIPMVVGAFGCVIVFSETKGSLKNDY